RFRETEVLHRLRDLTVLDQPQSIARQPCRKEALPIEYADVRASRDQQPPPGRADHLLDSRVTAAPPVPWRAPQAVCTLQPFHIGIEPVSQVREDATLDPRHRARPLQWVHDDPQCWIGRIVADRDPLV